MKRPAKLYVVIGTTGEYSDRTEWLVAAYTDEAKAQTHAQLATARAKELKPSGDGVFFDARYRRRAALSVLNVYDEGFRMYYTGTDYTVAEVQFMADVPRPVPS